MRRLGPLAVLSAVTLAGCTSAGPGPSSSTAPSNVSTVVSGSPPPASGSAAPGRDACEADYPAAVLPHWARGGFSPPTQPMPYVLGDRGAIVAILWSEHHPLRVPATAGRNNKITWVTRDGSHDPLVIRATLRSSGESVTRSLADGPGPSIVDLPSTGCWSLDLTWGTHHDHLELAYAPA